jgi:hypothetical protein
MRLLICRDDHQLANIPQELAPFRVGGGCPGVFGPNPSAGLDECANSMSWVVGTQAFHLLL